MLENRALAKTCLISAFATLLAFWSNVGPIAAASRERSLAEDAKRIVAYLADDSLAGRGNGTPGLQRAADFICSEFESAGLKFAMGAGSYRHEFSFGSWKLANLIGVLPGHSRPDELVIVSAHYDHLGQSGADGDSIYNGANDDASGVAAVVELARLLAAKKDNAKTIVFVAFAGEEAGLLGSFQLSSKMDAAKIAAMVNIEMIGTPSKWGRGAAFITGGQFTDLDDIIASSAPRNFEFRPDPFPENALFLRSDNLPFALKGVPALTVTTYNADADTTYHTPADQAELLDYHNMAQVILAIAPGLSVIAGEGRTPHRIDVYGSKRNQAD